MHRAAAGPRCPAADGAHRGIIHPLDSSAHPRHAQPPLRSRRPARFVAQRRDQSCSCSPRLPAVLRYPLVWQLPAYHDAVLVKHRVSEPYRLQTFALLSIETPIRDEGRLTVDPAPPVSRPTPGLAFFVLFHRRFGLGSLDLRARLSNCEVHRRLWEARLGWGCGGPTCVGRLICGAKESLGAAGRGCAPSCTPAAAGTYLDVLNARPSLPRVQRVAAVLAPEELLKARPCLLCPNIGRPKVTGPASRHRVRSPDEANTTRRVWVCWQLQFTYQPPSQCRTALAANLVSSDARKRAEPADSSGRPTRPETLTLLFCVSGRDRRTIA